MKILHLVLLSLILQVGCESDSTQAEILKYLIDPFTIEVDDENKEEKILDFKARNQLPFDASIIDYKVTPKLIEMNQDAFIDSMVVLVSSIVNDPQKGMLKIDEEWYYSSNQPTPLLLRRRIFGENQGGYIYETWAEETLMNKPMPAAHSD